MMGIYEFKKHKTYTQANPQQQAMRTVVEVKRAAVDRIHLYTYMEMAAA